MTEREISRAWGVIQRILEARLGQPRCRPAIEAIKSITRIEMSDSSASPFQLTIGSPVILEMADCGIATVPGSSAAMLALSAMELCAEDGIAMEATDVAALSVLARSLLKG